VWPNFWLSGISFHVSQHYFYNYVHHCPLGTVFVKMNKLIIYLSIYIYIYIYIYGCFDGAVVRTLYYKPTGCGFESNSYLFSAQLVKNAFSVKPRFHIHGMCNVTCVCNIAVFMCFGHPFHLLTYFPWESLLPITTWSDLFCHMHSHTCGIMLVLVVCFPFFVEFP